MSRRARPAADPRVDAPGDDAPSGLPAPLQRVVDHVMSWRAVRVLLHYSARRGPLLASGLAYQALFAVFAALWVAFAIAGLVVSGDLVLQRSLFRVLNTAIPGLIETDDAAGAIDPDLLLSASVFGWTGAIALVGLLFTALGWLAAVRDGVRALLELPGSRTNPVLQKLVDLAFGVGLGVALVLAAALSFAGTSATSALLDLVGIGSDSVPATIASRAVTLLVLVALYAAVLTGMYRVLSGVGLPPRYLRQGVLVAGVGLAGLTVLGTALLGGATRNPLIASFAVLVGLLIYFNFACQVILLGASWIAVVTDDDDYVLDERVAEERLEAARRLVEEHTPPEPEPRGPLGWIRRRLGRDDDRG